MQKILVLLLISKALTWDPLVAHNPSAEAQELYLRLQNSYGSHIISGQFAYGGEVQDVHSLTGRTPVVQGFDLQNYSPHNPWHSDWSSWDDGSVQRAINFYKNSNGKGIVTVFWHWFSPMGGNQQSSTFYTDQTNFDVSRAVQQGTDEYHATIRDIDAIATQLKRLRDERIPVIWRPLHEAGGRWFWWGAKGAGPCKALYEIMFTRFNQVHGLNNLIWAWSTPEADWYPGKDRVDLIGYDSYPGSFNYDCNINMYMQLHGIVQGSKLIAMTENGPIPDIDRCFSSGANWNFFMTWGSMWKDQNDQNHVKSVYSHNKVYTLENINI